MQGLFHKPLKGSLLINQVFDGMSQGFFHPFSEVKGSASVLEKGIPINQQASWPYLKVKIDGTDTKR